MTKDAIAVAVHSIVRHLHKFQPFCLFKLFFLAGVFEGLRKIVGVKSDFSASVEHLSDCRSESAADLAPLTSPIIRSTIKRKVDVDVNSGFSIKKK